MARLKANGWALRATTRTPEKADALAAQGIEPLIFDGTAPLPKTAFDGVTHVLHSVPPDADGDVVHRWHGEDMADLAPAWFGYLSTTGVYGDHGGAWIDETAPLNPATERGRRRVAAEAAWTDLWHRRGLGVHLFRLAGIYGPGRNQLDSVRSGTARRIDKPGQVFSRIHVDDIASVLVASITRPNPGAAYNVCDDEPAPPGEVITYACDLLGVEPPPWQSFEAASRDMSPMARSFYSESKRCSNGRIKQELGVRLTYPTYREGLRALHEAMEAQR